MHAVPTRSLPLMLLPRSRYGPRDDSLVQKQQLMGIQISKQINRERRGWGGGEGQECVSTLIISSISITAGGVKLEEKGTVGMDMMKNIV